MEKPEWTELEKNLLWYLYSFDQYEEKAEKGQTTPSHTKFIDKEYKRKRDNQSPPAKWGYYTEICRRCDKWRSQRIRYTCKKKYEKSRPRIAEVIPIMTPELRDAVQRGPPKMNNKRRFIMEETRTYINKRDKEEKLNKRNRQIEYQKGLTNLRIRERMRVRKPNQKSVAFEDERIKVKTPLQKEWEEVHFVFREYQIKLCKTKV